MSKLRPWAQPGFGRRLAGECSGACGDLGTLLAHGIGAMTVVGLAPAGVLFGFGAFLIGSGLFYGIPMAVQPMKAVSAVMLTGELAPGAVAASGLLIGATLLVLGATGAIRGIARRIPQTITAGLQLGLGLSMVLLGLRLMADTPWLGVLTLASLLVLMRVPGLPAVPVALALAVGIGSMAGTVAVPAGITAGLTWPPLVLPGWEQALDAFELAVLPQIPLTLTNAVIVTAAVARDLFPERSGRADERALALTTGIANLALAPFGAMPMCHGAAGIQAQHRFGARTGLAPILLGVVLLVLGLGFASGAGAVMGMIPPGAVGALLVIAGGDLALSKRLFDARPSCWLPIGVTAAVTLLTNPALGLAAGCLVELGRRPAERLAGRLRA
mgnify:CR=1 FL=1